ncbi:MAG TPA: ribose-phosphate diphosphokinase [Candidatus Saccharimonadia bacterium]|jgi:ribose-phosphate pyrophosphokinase|nr:ribose-phosphate diphosphokinase [Candidatus Saccharimonadia bacterium]
MAMEIVTKKRLQLLSGSYNIKLAEAVSKELGVPLAERELSRFASGEIRCRLGESVRGSDVFVFQAHNPSVNDAIMEQALLIDAAKRASARRITAVCPFWAYSKQDRKAAGREPISAKVVVDILRVAGADRMLSVDLHSGQIQGFFDGPFDHLTARPLLRDYIKSSLEPDTVIVSPDAGRAKVAERYTRQLGLDLAIIHKVRSHTVAHKLEARAVIGEVKDRPCVIIDDMIDTAGTIVAAAELLKKEGAAKIYVLATHGIFSEPAAERLNAAPIDKVVVTDTLASEAAHKIERLEVVSLAPLMAATIKAIYEDESVSGLFEGENQI